MTSVISCSSYSLNIDSFTLQDEEFVADVVQDVLMKDKATSSLIGGGNLSTTRVNVFRLKQSLDDPTVLCWRPWHIAGNEWPFIFILKLAEGKLLASKDLGASV